MTKTKQRFCLMAALILLITALPLSGTLAAEDNSVRVRLTKLNLTDRMTVSLDGSYTLNGIAFQRGSDLIISCAGGTLMVYYEGMTLDAGQSLTLVRHQTKDSEENGFRVNDAYYLHPGDLMLSVEDGALCAILRAPIEEYLLGVVPYEMSDSFPLEALKAQAVAARTYVFKHIRSSRSYDVVDNTNDQAYYGITKEHINARQAVDETRGVCGYDGKTLASCYYSASNGGQTELASHVWGGANETYLKMYDDPYDEENPQSMVYSYSLPKTLASADSLDALKEPVMNALSEAMTAMGYDGDTDQIRVTGIESAATHTAMYVDSPSKVMTKLRLSLYVSGRKMSNSSGEEEISLYDLSPMPTQRAEWGEIRALAQPVSIDLNLFPTVEAACGLSINSENNEIISVRETDSVFILESRRYGHGVGMSQRGAQWMAEAYNWNYEQILRFYYPGMTLKTVDLSVAMPTALGASFLTTPGPAASPTPKPLLPVTVKEGDRVALVTGISANSSLNLRDAPGMHGNIIKMLYYGQKLIVLGEEGEWLRVRTDAFEGYVMKGFVSLE